MSAPYTMSISQLPNLPIPHLPPVSIPATAAVTRILVLSNFSPALKTRDLQAAFAQWEGDKGGFRIKWIDDVTALVVFQDANIAKRAYLSLLLNPAPALPPPAQIKPYDGPDAQAIIHSVTARQHGHAGGRASMSGAGAGVTSGSMSGGISGGAFNFGQQQQQQQQGYSGQQGGIAGYAAQGSRNQGKPQPSSMDPGPALTGLGISNYGRHARSASTSSISASEPQQQHHGFNNTNSRNVSGGGNVSASNSGSSNTSSGRIGGGGAHARHGSSGSSAFGRNSAMGAFAFGAPAQGNGSASAPKEAAVLSPGDTSTFALPPVSSSASFRAAGGLGAGLATHHEGESPASTPAKGTASRATLESSVHPSSLAPAFGTNHHHQHQQEDATTPGIEILGAVPFPDGGPGGYLATQERRASGGTSSAASGAGKKDGAGAALDVLGGIRRESLDAKSAEKALREVSKALEGLGVGVAVAAGKS